MPKRPVQSVFFWPADMATPYRAVYGRVSGSSLYSKDFHQMAKPAAMAMERAFGLPIPPQGGSLLSRNKE